MSKLHGKGYPEAVCGFFTSQIDIFEEKLKVAQGKYVALVTKVDVRPDAATTSLRDADMESVLAEIDAAQKVFRDGVFADVRKLTT